MFFLHRKIPKLVAVVLIALIIVTNPAFVVAVSAATSTDAATDVKGNELPIITIDKSTTNQNVPEKLLSDTTRTTNDQKAVRFVNELTSYFLKDGKRSELEWLKTTDINFMITEDHKPIFTLETIQPFSQADNNGNLSFWQGRYALQSNSSTTANLGIGWRKLSDDKTNIVGVNTFFDYGFKNSLSRVGIGAEYFNKLAEYRTNLYIPTSGDRETGEVYLENGILYSYIRAVRGFDFEVGSTLATAPWLGFYALGFYYDNKYSNDHKGYKLRSQMQLTPRLSLETGYIKSGLAHGDVYGKIWYQLADTFGPSLSEGKRKQDNKPIDISYKIMQKVQRDNDIKTETFTRFVSYIGSLNVQVTNSSGRAIQGVLVQAYQNGNPVGNSAITDANGVALISGLNVGTYTAHAIYYNISEDSAAVPVQKDQTANSTITLPISGGNAIINVLNSQGQAIGGANVIAQMDNSLYAKAGNSIFDRVFGVKNVYAATAPFSVTATTNATGIAHFTNLPPGNYRFTVTYNSMTMTSVQVVVTNDSTGNTTVVLPVGGGNINATIIDAASQVAVNGATVILLDNGTTVDTKSTGNDGVVIFSGLSTSKTYTIRAIGAGASNVRAALTPVANQTLDVTIALDIRNNANITINDGTNPISGATVSVTVNGTVQTASTNGSGVASFTNIPTGTYTFTATMNGYTSSSASVSVNNGATAVGTISMTRQTGNANITINDGTNPISGATVSVTVNGIAQTASTNGSGVASFTNIPTGTYIFTATMNGYTSSSASVSVNNGATATETISMSRQTGNAMIFVNPGVGPISGAIVSVIVNGTQQTARTNYYGMAVFNNIPTGTYTFTAMAGGYTTNTTSVTITNGTTITGSIFLDII